MKDHKKVLAFALALSCAAGLASCSSESDGKHGYLMESETTTQHTVELNTETLAPEQEEQVANLADSLPDMELSNKTVKWMSFYDPWHPSGLGNSKPVSMELFEKKYGGDVEYVETTWATQYDDLATAVLGGEGIDFFPGIEAVPKCVISGITQSFDEYVDWENPLWKSVKELNDTYAVGGKHYFMACQSTAGYVVYYNRETIEDLGYDDPKELYEKGEWTMDKFKSMLMDFVDPEAGTYGLDGWFNQTPLYLASGVPSISIKDGKMSNNLMDPNLERAMSFQYDLFKNGLVLDKSQFSWNTQIQFMGEGKELFYIGGFYEVETAPEIWREKFGEGMFFVPIPRDEKADKYYYNAGLDGYNLCSGAGNPEGAARLMECVIASYDDENAVKISDDKHKEDYGWTDEMIEMKKEVERLTNENPIADVYGGLPKDTADIVGNLINQPLTGTDWYTARESIFDAVQVGVDDVNSQIN
ncbi:MAG: extracellular solute-binding protein [Oscillospiraceae bacterium]|nr:extracellular solute-binding protein [Oscillospiraceae bacterium]